MPYPDKVLGEDEEVVRHLHPHWLTVLRPVVLFLVLVGATSFGAALVPAGADQGTWRLVLVAAALLLGLVFVAVPLLRWRTTHYVFTTHRLLFRTGVLARHGRDIGLSRITDVSFRQSLWDRVVDSGTVSIETAGEGGPTVFSAIPDSEGVQQLLNQLVEEDADRRAARGGHPAGPYDQYDPSDAQHPTERF
ncbi:PH domain-containing protein [Modestobacter sp. VKM Ac-2986]|uniref:PH domain-containing protein n=1 Tax=Modestobacter sp. VKM Ac-2986 TaxID=3004140 RepID=UPI0022AB4ECE|nr:PH domain-containing protein [Modestobacter sp. VKM Ac-2986]MCZ2829765.1 PH domain-containing protein [Modestobacter sp. VKM Ac-2986]